MPRGLASLVPTVCELETQIARLRILHFDNDGRIGLQLISQKVVGCSDTSPGVDSTPHDVTFEEAIDSHTTDGVFDHRRTELVEEHVHEANGAP